MMTSRCETTDLRVLKNLRMLYELLDPNASPLWQGVALLRGNFCAQPGTAKTGELYPIVGTWIF